MKKGHQNSNYQDIATHFRVGDAVVPNLADATQSGRIVALFPAIGIAEVQFTSGNMQYPVEDLHKLNNNAWVDPPRIESVAGGLPKVPVSSGPSQKRVLQAFIKKALYWGARDRRYRASQEEADSGSFTCPRCKENQLTKAVYKMNEGKRVKLLGCPSCMFLIRQDDIVANDQVEITVKTDGKEIEVKV